MSGPLTRSAAALSRGWVSLYTAGSRGSVGPDRRKLIASDVWEQTHEADQDGATDRQLAADLLWRTVKGAPADIAWRLERGGLVVNLQLGLGRSTGIVLLLMMAVLAVGEAGYGAQVGGEEPYFTDGFPAYVSELGRAARHIGFSFGFAGLTLAGAALMFGMLRERAPIMALAAGVALFIAGVFFLAEAALGVRLFTLAEIYRDNGGVPRDPIWFAARDTAAIGESFGEVGLAAFSAGLVGFGLAYQRAGVGPPWIGRAALAAAGVMFAGAIGLIAGFDGFWFPFLFGALGVFAVVIILGSWLTCTGGRLAGDLQAVTAAAGDG